MSEKKYETHEKFTVYSFSLIPIYKYNLFKFVDSIGDRYYFRLKFEVIKNKVLYPICFVDESYIGFRNIPYVCNTDLLSIRAVLTEEDKLEIRVNLHNDEDVNGTKVLVYAYTRTEHKGNEFSCIINKENSSFIGYVNPRVSPSTNPSEIPNVTFPRAY